MPIFYFKKAKDSKAALELFLHGAHGQHSLMSSIRPSQSFIFNITCQNLLFPFSYSYHECAPLSVTVDCYWWSSVMGARYLLSFVDGLGSLVGPSSLSESDSEDGVRRQAAACFWSAATIGSSSCSQVDRKPLPLSSSY